MVKLQNIAKQLGNEVKHLGDGLQEEHERERESQLLAVLLKAHKISSEIRKRNY